jgi:hypothetical protein
MIYRTDHFRCKHFRSDSLLTSPYKCEKSNDLSSNACTSRFFLFNPPCCERHSFLTIAKVILVANISVSLRYLSFRMNVKKVTICFLIHARVNFLLLNPPFYERHSFLIIAKVILAANISVSFRCLPFRINAKKVTTCPPMRARVNFFLFSPLFLLFYSTIRSPSIFFSFLFATPTLSFWFRNHISRHYFDSVTVSPPPKKISRILWSFSCRTFSTRK